MLDIPDAAAARRTHPLNLKFRVEYLQVRYTKVRQRAYAR